MHEIMKKEQEMEEEVHGKGKKERGEDEGETCQEERWRR